VETFEKASRDPKDEKVVSGAVNELVIPIKDAKPSRPSVEAGFHALLGKCVIHTHCVYANYFNCINGGAEMLENIFKKASLVYKYYGFINPGAPLTFQIMDDINACKNQKTAYPNIIFLENHGLIVWEENVDKCVALYNKVNELLKEAIYSGTDLVKYPEFVSPAEKDGVCITVNPFLKEMLQRGIATKENIIKNVLSPDQLVYLNTSVGDEDSKLQVTKNAIAYRCTLAEATALEETLLGFIYLLYLADGLKQKLHNMPDSGIAFILGWDAEKYRKTQIQ
jgi:rhamnose utilization protein RhaD (predicted bifunctional aldolase and dehydrogenase)